MSQPCVSHVPSNPFRVNGGVFIPRLRPVQALGVVMQHTAEIGISPLTYQPAYEVLAESERKSQEKLQDTLRKLSAITALHANHSARSVHVKSHGLIYAEMEIYDHLPAALAQGMFAKAQTLPLLMRFSTVPGDILHDKTGTPRSLAIKVLGVEGERLPGSEAAITQNFLLVNGASFLSSSVQVFLANLKHMATTPESNTEFRHFLSQIFRATAKLVESLKNGQQTLIKNLHQSQETNILGETYFSQDPILYGNYMAKIAFVPIAPELLTLTNKPVDTLASDGLRKSIVDYFIAHTAVWELRVQLCTDLQKMPIEDSTVIWSTEASPYLPIARITAKPQIAWSPYRSHVVDEGMLFSPWHGITAHRPLGSVMRLRKMSYEMSKKQQLAQEESRICEPTSFDDLC